jgi:hypothetical protein
MIGWSMKVEQLVEYELAGKPKYSEKSRYGIILFTTNFPWFYLASNLVHRCEKPTTNSLRSF